MAARGSTTVVGDERLVLDVVRSIVLQALKTTHDCCAADDVVTKAWSE